jgi:hypothetical protein
MTDQTGRKRPAKESLRAVFRAIQTGKSRGASFSSRSHGSGGLSATWPPTLAMTATLSSEVNPMPTARRRPSFELLEERNLLSVYGLPWPDPKQLTVSFVPDGTSVVGTPSSLYKALNASMPTVQWKTDVLQALQSWAALGNINVGVVSDDGRALGSPGPLQGSPGVGDIRVAARPLSHDEIAIGSPYDPFGGWAGTIVFNSDATFGDSSSALENFLSAAVHEAGHVFGFADQHTDPSSVMYNVDSGAVTSPSPADAAALQTLYGARQGDPFEGIVGNGSFPTATPLVFNSSSAVNADVSTLTDKDVYSFLYSSRDAGPIAVDLRAAGLSLLTPKVSVYTATGQLVDSAQSTDPLNNNVTLTLPTGLEGGIYYVQVNSAQSNVFGIGGYRLAVGSVSQALAAVTASDALTSTSNGHGNNQIGSATTWAPSTSGTDARWPYTLTASLASRSDVDFYSVQTNSNTPGTALLTVTDLQSGTLTPVLTVFDSHRDPLNLDVLNSGTGGETVQVSGVTPNASLYIEVSSAPTSASIAPADYFLAMTFLSTPITNPTFASGTLTAPVPVDFRTLVVDSTRLFHFDLSGTTTVGSPPSAVLATVFDSSEKAVLNLRDIAGAGSSSGDVVLNPGTYIIRVIAATQTYAPLSPFSYTLSGQIRDDPDGPNPSDTTFQATGANPNGPPDDSGTWTNNGTTYYSNTLQTQEAHPGFRGAGSRGVISTIRWACSRNREDIDSAPGRPGDEQYPGPDRRRQVL